jgi:sucrose-6-phosphate hydrolase SacC (GH32 family)
VSSALTGDNFTGGFGGCAVFYYAGQFDGYTFTSGDAAPRRLSYGPDDYAPVTFSDTDDERRVMMGWLNHWGYAGNMGTTPWKGQMTLPRVLGWQNGALSQSLPTEVEGVWPQHQLSDEQSHSPLAVNSPVWEVLLPPLCDAWKLEARQNSELVFSLTRDEATSVWRLERFASALPPEGDAKPGWQQFFLSPVEAPLLSAGAGETRIVVDTCSVEVFGDDGTTLFCAQIFPTGSEWKISVAAA